MHAPTLAGVGRGLAPAELEIATPACGLVRNDMRFSEVFRLSLSFRSRLRLWESVPLHLVDLLAGKGDLHVIDLTVICKAL